MKKYFYEVNNLENSEFNIPYYHVLKMSDGEFAEWVRRLRKYITDEFDADRNPVISGKSESEIIESFKKLRENPADYWHADKSGDTESLGIIKNFNKHASPINQFFPSMFKTRITTGKSVNDSNLSVYDQYASEDREASVLKLFNRTIKRDSMYSWSKTIVFDKSKNPFWNGQDAVQFIKDVHNGEVFVGKYSNCQIAITRVKKSAEYSNNVMYISVDQLRKLVNGGYLSDEQMAISQGLEDGDKYRYMVRWYDKTTKIFPNLREKLRLGGGGTQPAVNFPALTAKGIYERYTRHIDTDKRIVLYDSSAGWGGRIIGAMASRKKFHYVGTDPNTKNFIDELGISRYEYVADFFNRNCVDFSNSKFNAFFEMNSDANTYEIFQDGSEVIHRNPKFQKYRGKLDLAFTSPPYFNREQYSYDETQSFIAYSEYDDWRDGFLRPTLNTIYEYLKRDRYCLWNISDIRVDKNTYYPLEQDSIDIMKGLGMDYKGKLKMLMTKIVGLNLTNTTTVKNTVECDGTVYKYEPIFVFHKP